MILENRIQALIAVGASVSANCQPCLLSAIALVIETGVNEQEIMEAIAVGKRIRTGAAAKMDEFTAELKIADYSSVVTTEPCCGCSPL